SRIVRTLSSVERSWSVSSILRMKAPPLRRAKSQLNRAVRAPPTWRNPVGLGAKRTRTPPEVTVLERVVDMTLGLKPIPLRRSKRFFHCPCGLHDVYGVSVLEGSPMSHLPPHRVKPRPHILVSSAILGLLAFFLAAGPYPVALPSDGRLPGSIAKAPAYVAGFPIPFPRTVDIRPRQGSVVAADLDADGRQELVVSIPSGQILVLRTDGFHVPVPGWTRTFDDLEQPA